MKKKVPLVIILLVTAILCSCSKESNTDSRDMYEATYKVTETWNENGVVQIKPVFNMTIEKSSQHNDMVLLNNFANYGAGYSAEASVSGNEVTIPQQTLPNSRLISGFGLMADTTLTITYTETLGSTSFIVTAIAKKR